MTRAEIAAVLKEALVVKPIGPDDYRFWKISCGPFRVSGLFGREPSLAEVRQWEAKIDAWAAEGDKTKEASQ